MADAVRAKRNPKHEILNKTFDANDQTHLRQVCISQYNYIPTESEKA
jgi:hypothetical protein